jgi:hypothetical protein
VKLEKGMKVFYDCPSMGDDAESDSFFRKYRHKTATIVGFGEYYVGLLDKAGRSPGVYVKPNSVHVRFSGERHVHHNLNLKFFVLVDPVVTVKATPEPLNGKVRDLPYPILFYPGDVVKKNDNPEPRIIESVDVDDTGKVFYFLAERKEDKEKREEENARLRDEHKKKTTNFLERLFPPSRDYQEEKYLGKQLKLIKRGNVYHLYSGTGRLAFDSHDEELTFWSQDGISETVFGSNGIFVIFEWSFDGAFKKFEKREGDIIVMSGEPYKDVRGITRERFTLRKLLPPFKRYRRRVRALTKPSVAVVDFSLTGE